MEGIITFVKEGVRIIKFNKPERKNAIPPVLYDHMARILNEDARNNDIVVTIFTGTGEYFTSGNDMKAAMEKQQIQTETASDNFLEFRTFVEALINYPKIIIAVVNGPAVGVGVTMLGLCDVVYASDHATFHAPFVTLGLCAEACSSYTFPRIMGRSRAGEILLLGKKLTAQEAYDCGLVSQIILHDQLDELLVKLQKFGKLPVNSVRITKRLIMQNISKNLHQCNKNECEALAEAVDSEDFSNAIMSFMMRKSKL